MENTIHIGDLIREQLKQQQRTEAWLARQIDHDCSNLNKQLDNYWLPTEMLLQISNVLKFDFFVYYSAQVKL
ncbi:hypothetical protein FACS189429_6730 [Bacteroidia bacterium]|nr:hypothetical protein FACS189429_6730 [Bacteroidia bacterium]